MENNVITILKEINAISRRINTFPLDEVISVILDEFPQLFNVSYVAIYLSEIEDYVLSFRQHTRELPLTERIQLKEKNNIMTYAAELDEAVITFGNVAEYEKECGKKFDSLYLNQFLENFCLLAPLYIGHDAKKEFIGMLVFADRNNGENFTELEQLVASQMAELLAATISRNRLLEPIKNTSMIDALTGAFRWHPFYEYLAREVYRADRYQCDLAMVLVDIDNLKNVNKRFSNASGDKVLQESAMLINRALRNVDIVSRKEDSFLIILPETKVSDAMIVAERLRRFFAQHDFLYNEEKLAVTVSVGVVGYRPGDAPLTFLKKGEMSLLRAQEKGGNQIITYNVVANE